MKRLLAFLRRVILRQKQSTEYSPVPQQSNTKVSRVMTPYRRQKIVTGIAIGLIAVVVILSMLAGLHVLPDSKITNYEIRVVVVLFLVICLFIMLSIFMLRNAVVTNTAFLIRTKDSLVNHGRSVKELEKQVTDNTGTNKHLIKEIEELNRNLYQINKTEE